MWNFDTNLVVVVILSGDLIFGRILAGMLEKNRYPVIIIISSCIFGKVQRGIVRVLSWLIDHSVDFLRSSLGYRSGKFLMTFS